MWKIIAGDYDCFFTCLSCISRRFSSTSKTGAVVSSLSGIKGSSSHSNALMDVLEDVIRHASIMTIEVTSMASSKLSGTWIWLLSSIAKAVSLHLPKCGRFFLMHQDWKCC